jgi:hypothetical protein
LTFISHNGFYNFLQPGREGDLNPSLHSMFMQQDHVILFFKEFKLCAPHGSRSLIKCSAMPCHSYSGQQQHMIDKQPEKCIEKSVDHMKTYDCGIIFSVSIKY